MEVEDAADQEKKEDHVTETHVAQETRMTKRIENARGTGIVGTGIETVAIKIRRRNEKRIGISGAAKIEIVVKIESVVVTDTPIKEKKVKKKIKNIAPHLEALNLN